MEKEVLLSKQKKALEEICARITVLGFLYDRFEEYCCSKNLIIDLNLEMAINHKINQFSDDLDFNIKQCAEDDIGYLVNDNNRLFYTISSSAQDAIDYLDKIIEKDNFVSQEEKRFVEVFLIYIKSLYDYLFDLVVDAQENCNEINCRYF